MTPTAFLGPTHLPTVRPVNARKDMTNVSDWLIYSRSSLKEGLYHYDAISRLQDVNFNSADVHTNIGRYLRLGPLGTALLPRDTPRVLLIDEIDKADLDFPNDMLTVFEEGEY